MNLNFIFDTGAENIIVFDREIPELFGIEYDRRIEVMGSDFSTGLYANIIRNIFFRMGEARTVKRDVVVLEENILLLEERLGIKVDGIIGGSFFRNLIVQINYPKKQIRLYHPQKVKKGLYEKFTEFDITVANSKPYLKARTTVNNNVTLDLTYLIDSGASLPFLIHTNSDSLLTLPDMVQLGSLGFGITGILKGYIGQVQELNIGPYKFNNVITSFQDVLANDTRRTSTVIKRNGLIGTELLRRFHVIIDYFNHKAYLRPIRKKRYAKSFDYDRSGMTIFAVGIDLNEFLVKDVIENTPAYDADIRAGDIILKIGSRKTKLMNLEAVNGRLQGKAGKKIKLEILREGERIKKSFKLRDWFK